MAFRLEETFDDAATVDDAVAKGQSMFAGGEEQVGGISAGNTAEDDDEDAAEGYEEWWCGDIDDGPAADDDDDEYEATIEANGAEANGGFWGDDDPEAGSLPLGEDEPAEATSSLALSMHSNFRFWLLGEPITATTGGGSGDMGWASRYCRTFSISSRPSASTSAMAGRPTSSGRTPWLTSACRSSGGMATMA